MEEVNGKSLTEIAEQQCYDGTVGQNFQPRHTARGSNPAISGTAVSNQFEFLLIDPRMLIGSIRSQKIPSQAHDNSEEPATVEGHPPTPVPHDECNQHGRERSTKTYAKQSETASQTTATTSHPVRNHLGIGGSTRSFADANQKPDNGERPCHPEPMRDKKLRSKSSRRRQDRPPCDGRNQYFSRAVAIRQISPRDLREGIAEKKGAQDPSHGLKGNRKLILDKLACNAQIQAVEISQEGGRCDQPHHLPSYRGGAGWKTQCSFGHSVGLAG